MTPEQKLKRQLKRIIEENNGYWSLVQGGQYSKPGDPDLIACIDGRFIGIEAKTPTGRQSDMQKLRQKQIEDAGGIYLLVRSEEELVRQLQSYNII